MWATGVARMTIAKLLKKVALAPSRLPRRRSKKAQRKQPEALELDEMWTFVGCKQRKVWRWLPVERASRRIVAWVLGHRYGPALVGPAATAATTPTNGTPTPKYYRANTTGPDQKAAATRALPKLLIVPYASAAACWFVKLARSAKAYPCTPLELKL